MADVLHFIQQPAGRQNEASPSFLQAPVIRMIDERYCGRLLIWSRSMFRGVGLWGSAQHKHSASSIWIHARGIVSRIAGRLLFRASHTTKQ